MAKGENCTKMTRATDKNHAYDVITGYYAQNLVPWVNNHCKLSARSSGLATAHAQIIVNVRVLRVVS